ncbi:hypothetical protein, partial [Actinomadura bangladeshensis]
REGDPAQPGAEPRDASAGGTAPDGGTDDQRSTDDASPPSGETDQSAEAPEPSGEHDGDHGKKGQDDGPEQNPDETNQIKPEVPGNPIISDVHTDSRGQVHVEPRYGREHTGEPGTELARSQPETTEPAQLPDREDLDPVGAGGGEGGRGELRDPGDDPENRDLRERDPERPPSPKDIRREMFRGSEELRDAANEAARPAFKHLDSRPPQTQPCAVRDISDRITATDQPIKAGDAMVGAVSGIVVAVELVRQGVGLFKRYIGRRHAGNG